MAKLAAGTGITFDYDAPTDTLTLDGAGGAGQVVGATFTFGDGTNVIASSELPQYAEIPYAATVGSWKVVSVDGTSGTIAFLVHRAAAGSPTTFSEISGGSDPGLSAATSAEDTAISGDWTDVTIDAFDILRVSVSGSPTSVKRVSVLLRLTRD